MPDLDDVRRIARGLPETVESGDVFRLTVRGRAICWTWLERLGPKLPRQARPEVLAVRVAGLLAKEDLLGIGGDVFFTEPHYDGFPAVLVRLPAIDDVLLERVLTDAWRVQAPRDLVRDWDRPTPD